ncbi:MAG: PEP/pyruvate-binding domain-containing protein [Thermodesulfobacteriota bacterium]|nr:PEP/pyruvate-binding domain-containing protein [Thermodesulfobacteriota bacterium]
MTDTQPVFIHRQVEADVSMVINSINMVEERWDEVIINSARGAGAGLVSGKVDSDLYFIDAPALSVKRVIKSIKRTKCVFDEEKGYGTRFVPIDDKAEQTTPSLSEQDAAKIAKLARHIHEFFHYPVDIEAIKRGKKIYVVQVRPIVLPFI